MKIGAFYLKKLKRLCPDFDNAIQGQNNGIILCSPQTYKTFV